MQQQVGKYQLIRKLAVGGMAEVYLAKAEGPMGFAKTLVLKRILSHLGEDQQFVDMFLNEAKLAAQLNHPNVVQIFDFGEADGAYYIAMEYIDGPNLRALAKRAAEVGQRLPFSLAAKTISFACEGLAYAHDFCDGETGEPLNLIHRDISPDNILLARNGAVKVVDFGIAKAAGQGHHTKTGTLKGKLAYMPPEQLGGKPLDKRVDIFALGIVLYELVCGEKPFDASSEVSIMRSILYEPLTPAVQKRPDTPPQLAQILDKALAKDRDQRYQSCREFQSDLERFILSTGEPVGAYQLQQLVAQLAAGTGGSGALTPPPGSGSGPKSRPGVSGSSPNLNPRTPSNPALRANVPPPPQPAAQPADSLDSLEIAIGTSVTQAVPPPGAATSATKTLAPEPAAIPLTTRKATTDTELPPPAPNRTPLIFGGAGLVIALGVGAMLYVKSQNAPKPTPVPDPVVVAKVEPPPAKVEPKKEEPPKQEEKPVVAEQAVVDAGSPVAVAVEEDKFEPPPKDKKGKTKTTRGKTNDKVLVAKEEPANTTVVAKYDPRKDTQTDARPSVSGASFEVVSEPAGQVRVNGKFVGASGAAKVSNVPVGDVKVEVYDSRLGFSKTQTFNVSAGDNGVKKIVVEKGTLDIRIRPYATVFLDGKPLGDTPIGTQTVFEGKHELKLVNRDLKYEKSFDIVVKPGAPTTFKKNLEEGD